LSTQEELNITNEAVDELEPASVQAPPTQTRSTSRSRTSSSSSTTRHYARRPKVCAFCVEGIKEIDYKQVDMLRRFITEQGKIKPRRQTGTCAKHQRRLAVAIKRARHLALLPFSAEQAREWLMGG